MSYIGEFMSYILFAVFAQNILLGRAIGLSSIMTAVSRKGSLPKLVLLVGCWSTVGILFMWYFSRFVNDMNGYLLFALFHSLICAVQYFATDRIMQRFTPEAYDAWGRLLPHALINSIIVGVPLSALSSGIPNWYSALGYAAGSAVGLGLGVVIVQNGLEVLNHPDIPKSFRGVPIMLIYLGILSLGFCVFL